MLSSGVADVDFPFLPRLCTFSDEGELKRTDGCALSSLLELSLSSLAAGVSRFSFLEIVVELFDPSRESLFLFVVFVGTGVRERVSDSSL